MARIRTTKQARELRVTALGYREDKRYIDWLVESISQMTEKQLILSAQIEHTKRVSHQSGVKKKFLHRRPRAF